MILHEKKWLDYAEPVLKESKRQLAIVIVRALVFVFMNTFIGFASSIALMLIRFANSPHPVDAAIGVMFQFAVASIATVWWAVPLSSLLLYVANKLHFAIWLGYRGVFKGSLVLTAIFVALTLIQVNNDYLLSNDGPLSMTSLTPYLAETWFFFIGGTLIYTSALLCLVALSLWIINPVTFRMKLLGVK